MGQTEEVERERSEGGRESGGIGQVAAAMSLGNAAAYGGLRLFSHLLPKPLHIPRSVALRYAVLAKTPLTSH